jgi:hypothetical protein
VLVSERRRSLHFFSNIFADDPAVLEGSYQDWHAWEAALEGNRLISLCQLASRMT